MGISGVRLSRGGLKTARTLGQTCWWRVSRGDLLDFEKIKFLCTAALAHRQRETSVLTSAPQAALLRGMQGTTERRVGRG